ncbi:hypothetical protein SAMN05444411_11318 [Lutibacter oricola]|uniref:Outer membrane protein beta-barrel family protein n=1 Tax=Lutibacter oricola TaxID=762486 RepID=A0A1H3G1L1_9FLAO|nr:hypothetical protein [Lutibacter oricola]SDX97232.1 hypothetical protein SAMN05444411_11318 [Lutibacter oricola]
MKKLFILFLFLGSFLASAQSNSNNSDLNLYLDCGKCDHAYIKQNLSHVNFVRDQKYADVYILVRTERNGSGGVKYSFEFQGQHRFKKMRNRLSFSTKSDDTSAEKRDLVFEYLKLGLVKFWLRSGNDDVISVQLKEEDKTAVVEEVKDSWNKWVFNVGLRGTFRGEEVKETKYLNYNASAKRVTEKNKFFIRVSRSNDKKIFRKDSGTTITRQESTSFSFSNVFSLNNHWSAGFFGGMYESTYKNFDLSYWLRPAIEYNFFDYKQSFKKQLVLSYRVGGSQNNYIETTIFDEDEELLWEHSFNLGGAVQQKWGNVSGEISYSSYLHDTSLSAVSFDLGTNFRLFKGFSLSLNGSYDITDNQVNLAAGDLSLEDLLLAQKQAQSGYKYSLRFGLNYSFGSMYNTIVNPRFNF